MYFGIFKELRELNMADCQDYDLYQGYFAEFYDSIAQKGQYDSELYIKQAFITGSPVLELACGSGRVLLQLAAAGHTVMGVDLSVDMLDLVEKKLEKQPKRIRQRVVVQQGDMTALNLGKTFKLIILPATSISLLKSEAELYALFDCVYQHLEPNGRFIFDYRITEGLEDKIDGDKLSIWTKDSESGIKQFVLYGEQIHSAAQEANINFYGELVEGGKTSRFFGHSIKRLWTDETIQAVIQKTNFTVADTRIMTYGEYEKVKFIILEKRVS